MRSKLSAITARTPSRRVPLRGPVARGAGAVLLAADHDERHALLRVAHRRVVDRQLLAVGQVAREAALGQRLTPGPPSRLRRRMFAKVPRIITSWLPRRAP